MLALTLFAIRATFLARVAPAVARTVRGAGTAEVPVETKTRRILVSAKFRCAPRVILDVVTRLAGVRTVAVEAEAKRRVALVASHVDRGGGRARTPANPRRRHHLTASERVPPTVSGSTRYPLPLPVTVTRYRYPLPLPVTVTVTRYRYPLPLPVTVRE